MNCAEKLLEPTIFFNLYTYHQRIPVPKVLEQERFQDLESAERHQFYIFFFFFFMGKYIKTTSQCEAHLLQQIEYIKTCILSVILHNAP